MTRGELSCTLCNSFALVSSLSWHPSLSQLIPASDLDQLQSMPINSNSSCFHTSPLTLLLLRHMFSPIHKSSSVPQCSRQRKRHSTDWCAGTRHRHRPATPGRAAGGGLLALLLFCSTSPLSTICLPDVLLLSRTEAITAPTHPALPRLCGIQS